MKSTLFPVVVFCAIAAILHGEPNPAQPATTSAPEAGVPAPSPFNVTPRVEVHPGEIQITALIDAITELHVSKDGIYWVNGEGAKPGLWEPNNFPTLVNGQRWYPHWHKPAKRRGYDRCDAFQMAIPSLDLDLELIAVGEKPDGKEIEPRSPITLSHDNGELIVTIPDPEWGARWYTFVLVPAKK
jgi:hypothetical protein